MNILTIGLCRCSPYAGRLQGTNIKMGYAGSVHEIQLQIEELLIPEDEMSAALKSDTCDLYLFDDPLRSRSTKGIAPYIVLTVSSLAPCEPGTNEVFVRQTTLNRVSILFILEKISELIGLMSEDALRQWRNHMRHSWDFGRLLVPQ